MFPPTAIEALTSSAPSSRPADVAVRPHYRIRRHETDPRLCVREPRTPHGAEMLAQHYDGWQLTHDLLGACAPATCRLDGGRIEIELIEGNPVHLQYGAAWQGGPQPEVLPWPVVWSALETLWSTDRGGPANEKMSVTTLWATWYAISRLREAKRQAIAGWIFEPSWSFSSILRLTIGKLRGGYSRVPPIAVKIYEQSKTGLIAGDMHFANLVGNRGRVAFVDFSEVAAGPIALDLAPLWLEWWLARGLVRGDDGFLDGFRRLWRTWVAPERALVEMTREWTGRAFPWLYYAFFADHLELDPALARQATVTTMAAIDRLQHQLTSADTLEQLVAGYQ